MTHARKSGRRGHPGILVADDDEDDRLFTAGAFQENGIDVPLDFVVDGQDLLDYLLRTKKYAGQAGQPLPGLILLDLNMPRKNGIEALRELRAIEHLRLIPVIVLTTSAQESDVLEAYEAGANSYSTKPSNNEGLIELVRLIHEYWHLKTQLPRQIRASS